MLGASSEEVSDKILINSTVAQMRKEKCAALNGTVKFWRVGVGLRVYSFTELPPQEIGFN